MVVGAFVRDLRLDGSGGKHGERDGGAGGVESAAAPYDQPDLGVEACAATVTGSCV